MNIKLPFHQSWFDDDEINEVVETLKSGWLTTGPRTKQFEDNFAQFCGTKYAVGCSSGTDALLMSLVALKIGCGAEVITTPFSFTATCAAIIAANCVPIFCDIDPHTFCISPSKLENSFKKYL